MALRLRRPAIAALSIAVVVREGGEESRGQRRRGLAPDCFAQELDCFGSIAGAVGVQCQSGQSARFSVTGNIRGAEVVAVVDDFITIFDKSENEADLKNGVVDIGKPSSSKVFVCHTDEGVSIFITA